jgi:hypothetical protein
MASDRDDGTAGFDEENPTTRFEAPELRALLSRSVAESTMFQASGGEPLAPADVERPLPPPAHQVTPAPTFLEKSSALLVLPPDSPGSRPAEIMPTLAVPQPTPPAPSVPLAPAVRSRRPRASRGCVQTKPTMRGHLVRLALLLLVVVAQPWWWNVGDVNAHRVASAHR